MSGNPKPTFFKLPKPIVFCVALISIGFCFHDNLYSQEIGKTSSVSTTQLSGCSTVGEAGEYIWQFAGPRIVLESDEFPEQLIEVIRNTQIPNLSVERDAVLSWEMNKADFSLTMKSNFPDYIVKKNSKSSKGIETANSVIKYKPARFTIAGANIPKDLVEAIAGRDGKVNLIQGSWKISESKIVFSNVVVNGRHKSDKVAELEIFFTGVIRIATSETQYVF